MARLKRAPPLVILAAALVVAQASAAGRNGERWSPPVPDLASATSEWVPLSAQPRATEPQAFFAPPPPQFQLHQLPFGQSQLNQFQQQSGQSQLNQFQQQSGQSQLNQFQQQGGHLNPQSQFQSQAQLHQTPSFPPPQINHQSQYHLQPPQLPRQQQNNHNFLHQVGIPQNLQHFILTPPKQDFPVPNIQQVLFAPPPPPSPPQPPQQPSHLPSLPPLPRLPQLQQRPIGVQHPPLPPPPPPQAQSLSQNPNPVLQREKEEVQLLYVPVETLRQRGRLPQPSIPTPQPTTTPPPPPPSPLPSSTPTPHQPPLSVYMGPGGDDAKISDVLQLLKDARTIPVLDQVGPDAPQVFVGPAGLHPPPGYAKFELPYLSSLDSNRIERKVNRLPFFVAPLSFQPPSGYSKILLPPPHIGSVVVSNSTSPTPTPVFVSSTTPLPPPPSTESSASSGHGVFSLPSQVTPVNPRLPTLVNSLEDTNVEGTPQQVRHGGSQRGRKRPRPHQQPLLAPSTERVFVQSTSLAPPTPSPTQAPSSTSLPPVFSTQEPQDVRLAPTDRSIGPSTERSLRVHQANELHSFIQAAQQEQVDQFNHVTQQPFQQVSSLQPIEQFPQVTTQQPFGQSQGQFFSSTLEPFGRGQFFDFNPRPQGENQFVPPKSADQSQPENNFRPQNHFVQFPQREHIFSTPVATSDSRPQFKPKQPVFGQAPQTQFREEQNRFSRPQEDIQSSQNHFRQPEQQPEQEEDVPPQQGQFESVRNQLRQPNEHGQNHFRRPQDQEQHRFVSPQQVFETSLGPSQELPQPQEQPIQTDLPSPAPTPVIAPTPDPTPALVQVRGRIQGVQEVAVLPQVPLELQRPPHHRQRVQSYHQQEPSSTTQATPSSSVPTRRRSRPRPTQNTVVQEVNNDPLAVRFTGKIRNRTRNHQQFIQRQQQQEEEQRQIQQQDQQLSVTSQSYPSETTALPANTVEDENFGQRSTIEEQPTTRAIPTRKYSNFVRAGARRPSATASENPEATTPISGRTRATATPPRRAPHKVNRGRVRARTTTTPSSAPAEEVVPTQAPYARRRPTTEASETANEVPDSEEQESVLPPHSALQSTADRLQSVVQQSVGESADIPTEKTAQWGDRPQVSNEPAVEIVQSAPIASTTFDWSAHAGSQLSNGWAPDRNSPEAVPPIRYDGLGIPSVSGNPVDAPPSDHALPDADIITTTVEPPLKDGNKKAVVGKKRGSWVRVRVKRPRGGAGSDSDGLATAESQNAGVASGNALLPQPLTPSPLLDIETSPVPITTTPSSLTTPIPTVIPTSSEVPPTSTSYDVEMDSTNTPEPIISEDALTTEQPNSTLPPPANSPFVGTSTSTKVSMETEICYRGRCIKTQTQSGQA